MGPTYDGDDDGVYDYSDGDGFLINMTIMKKTLKYIYKNFRYLLCICPFYRTNILFWVICKNSYI